MATESTQIPCPHCGCKTSKKVTYTWWGGMVVPRMFNLVTCTDCKKSFDGKSGADNSAAVAKYRNIAAILGLGGALFILAVIITMNFIGWQ